MAIKKLLARMNIELVSGRIVHKIDSSDTMIRLPECRVINAYVPRRAESIDDDAHVQSSWQFQTCRRSIRRKIIVSIECAKIEIRIHCAKSIIINNERMRSRRIVTTVV